MRSAVFRQKYPKVIKKINSGPHFQTYKNKLFLKFQTEALWLLYTLLKFLKFLSMWKNSFEFRYLFCVAICSVVSVPITVKINFFVRFYWYLIFCISDSSFSAISDLHDSPLQSTNQVSGNIIYKQYFSTFLSGEITTCVNILLDYLVFF